MNVQPGSSAAMRGVLMEPRREEFVSHTHGAVVKRCSHDGCTNQAKQGGVCITHGSVVKRCSHKGCTKQAQKGGVCWIHGASKLRKRCRHEGCTKCVQKGGLCTQHYRMSLVAAQDQVMEEGYEVTTTGGGGFLVAAPQPALASHLPSFLVGDPPESVTVSIIVENNDNFPRYCPTSVQGNNDGDNIDWNDLLICLS
jgi:hypothetical protein